MAGLKMFKLTNSFNFNSKSISKIKILWKMEKPFIPEENIQVKFRSKIDINNAFSMEIKSWSLLNIVEWFLPHLDKCPASFFRDVLKDNKKTKLISYIILNRFSKIARKQSSVSWSIWIYSQGKMGICYRNLRASSVLSGFYPSQWPDKDYLYQSWTNSRSLNERVSCVGKKE